MRNHFLIFFLTTMLLGCSVKYEEQLQSDILGAANLKDPISSTIQSKCGASDITLAERDEFQFINDTFIRTKVLYADAKCKNEVGRLIYNGEFAADNTQTINEVTIRISNEKFAKYLNTNNFCGFTAYHNGQSIVFRGESTLKRCPPGNLPNNVRAVQQLLSGR